MPSELVNTASRLEAPEDRRLYGVALAQVICNNNKDYPGQVQVHIVGLCGIDVWARVVTPMSGANKGFYFMPQEDDEVLVAYNQGDVEECYVVGCLWNGKDRAPVKDSADAVNKRIIRTPGSHEVVLDDKAKSITITSATGQRVFLSQDKVTVSMDKDDQTAVTLDSKGNITLKAKSKITLDAQTIDIGKGNSQINIG